MAREAAVVFADIKAALYQNDPQIPWEMLAKIKQPKEKLPPDIVRKPTEDFPYAQTITFWSLEPSKDDLRLVNVRLSLKPKKRNKAQIFNWTLFIKKESPAEKKKV